MYPKDVRSVCSGCDAHVIGDKKAKFSLCD